MILLMRGGLEDVAKACEAVARDIPGAEYVGRHNRMSSGLAVYGARIPPESEAVAMEKARRNGITDFDRVTE
jgi:hypothetical protein